MMPVFGLCFEIGIGTGLILGGGVGGRGELGSDVDSIEVEAEAGVEDETVVEAGAGTKARTGAGTVDEVARTAPWVPTVAVTFGEPATGSAEPTFRTSLPLVDAET